MEEQIKKIEPQDGNQIVVFENNGTINVHNHSKENKNVNELSDKINDSFARMEKFFRENKFQIKTKRGRKRK